MSFYSVGPAGSNGQIQFNDNGGFGGDVDLTYNKTTNKLTTGGDVELNDGGSFTTTLQTVTPTANRTISFPNATGTVGLVAGSSGQLVYNNAGANAGVPSSVVGATGNITLSLNGATGVPPVAVTGTWFAGTTPQVLIQPSNVGTAGAWSASGTGIGVNAVTAFGGNLLDLQVNGTSQFKVSNIGSVSGITYNAIDTGGNIWAKLIGAAGDALQLTNSSTISWCAGYAGNTPDLRLARDTSNILAQRNAANAQTFRVYNTFTDASNYERLSTTWSSNVCYTKPENAGTGSARLYVPVTGATTVSGLPAAATAGAGARAFVTDANATTFLSTVAGGGANKVPVVSDGTNWLIG
jgi:hypothetical protein